MAALDYSYLASLVSRVQDGDSNAFAELYAATYQKEYRFAYKYLKEEYLAQDALQETYILALNHIGSLKDPKLFVSWLNQINFRVCFKMHQRRQKYNAEMTEYDNNSETYRNRVEDSPEQQIVKVDQEQYIIRQVMSLPFSESQAILLRYYNNMKLDEIAKLLDCSRSSVKRYIKNGQDRLRKLIKQ